MKIFVQFGTGYCGEEGAEVFQCDGDDNMIESWCQDIAFDNSSMFGRDSEEDEQDCWWEWEEYSAEKHDMYRAGGGSFKEDF